LNQFQCGFSIAAFSLFIHLASLKKQCEKKEKSEIAYPLTGASMQQGSVHGVLMPFTYTNIINGSSISISINPFIP
jgi:hypothetical protein